MDTRQYLYCLKPKKEFAEKAGIIKGVTVIGKLDIVWKTNLGERGRLQTSQLQRMVSPENTECGVGVRGQASLTPQHQRAEPTSPSFLENANSRVDP